MLILTRYVGETVLIGDGISVTVLSNRNGQVKLGFTAPKDVLVLRSELLAREPDGNRAAKEGKSNGFFGMFRRNK